MTTAILLPELGTGGERIRVSSWLVEPGDAVEVGDRVVEVLMRGITFDVSSHAAGVITRIEKPFDSEIAPGDVLGWIEEGP